MRAYEVFLNGSRLCLAGIDGNGVLNATVHYGCGQKLDHLHLTVGGLLASTREQLTWAGADLKLGDEVHLKVVDVVLVDKPEVQPPIAPEKELESHKAYVRAMAAKWGWTLMESPEPL